MAISLKSLVYGDSGVGKTSACKLLSAGRQSSGVYEAAVNDPATRTQLVFRLEENDEAKYDPPLHTIGILVFYNITDRSSYNSVMTDYLPTLSARLNPQHTFIMLIGTHSDIYEREVSSDEAEELANEYSAFHMEISCKLVKNIELTLKLMKTRSVNILKKYPQLREVPDDMVNMSSPVVVQNTSLRNLEIWDSPRSDGDKATTPQFSGKGKKSHTFEMPTSSGESSPESRPFVVEDLPMQFDEFQKRKHLPALPLPNNTHVEEKSFAAVAGEMIATFDKQKLNLADNLSFANMSEISNRDESSFIETIDPLFEDTMEGVRRVPRLTDLPRLPSGPNTERRAASPMAPQHFNTDRPGREALMYINCCLPTGMRKVEVLEGDSAFDVAERAYPCGEVETLQAMAEFIEEKVSLYLLEVSRSLGKDIIGRCHIELEQATEQLYVRKGDSPRQLAKEFCDEHDLDTTWESRITNIVQAEYGQDLGRKLLFKINVDIRNQTHVIKVRQGDKLETLAKAFAEQHRLGENGSRKILGILQHSERSLQVVHVDLKMAGRSNPLLARPVVTGPDPSGPEILNRFATSANPAVAILTGTGESVLGAMSRARGHKSSAAVNINIDEEDKLPPDFVEAKEPLESILFSIFNEEPEDSSVYTFVENLKTGKFSKISDNSLVIQTQKPSEYKPVSQESVEIAVYLRLHSWSVRLHRIFVLMQGFLAGIALLHLYLVFWNNDNVKFLPVYASLSRVIAGLFHILVTWAIVGSVHLLITERQHFKHISATVIDYDTEKHRLPFYTAISLTVAFSIWFVITVFNAMFVNKMFYEDQRDPEQWDNDGVPGDFGSGMSLWASLWVLRAVLIILTWILLNTQTHWNVGSLYLFKIEELERRALIQDYGADVYRHLFYGNPYLPQGLFQIGEEDDTLTDEEDVVKKAG